MAEMVLRAGHNDQRVIEDLLTNPRALQPRHSRLIRRLVVDAVAAARTDVFARAATDSATQLLIDPMTQLLTSTQGVDDSWAALPFATASAVPLSQLRDPAYRAHLIEHVVEFELDHGATGIIPPYIHVPDPEGPEAEIAVALMRETRLHVDDLGLGFQLLPVVSVDLRKVSLDHTRWAGGLGRLLRTANRMADAPVALGLSMSSKLTETSIYKSARIWRRAATIGPFIAWHAGQTGLLAITMGATGYEAGMASNERYDVNSQQRNRMPQNSGPAPRYTGVYVETLGHSLSKSAVTTLANVRGVAGDLTCMDPLCCPSGLASMTGAGRRQHAVRARLVDLEELNSIGARGWRLHHLSSRAGQAAAAAQRIRAAADRLGVKVGAYPEPHLAMERVTLGLRETARSAIA
ncbi:hypothetical protein GCM10009795_005060 [Nocardioides hankookensis]|uniref:Methylmalonyl-CoA mutase domain-containing protein n=1 Tax=Nocardioides hankookensis TaxID=443157 RepID=A0ABW1LLI1_9ACTN